jgi:hypothetical protein
MTTDTAAQPAILTDALTEIVDLATAGPTDLAPPAQMLARVALSQFWDSRSLKSRDFPVAQFRD